MARPTAGTTVWQRLWNRVDTSGDCWVWTGARHKSGYAYMTGPNPPKTVRINRLAYELCNGPIPVGLDVCHSCDNKLCVRPSHLWVGTRAENNHDRERKGRGVYLRGEA